jgi:HupE/UreJ protein
MTRGDLKSGAVQGRQWMILVAIAVLVAGSVPSAGAHTQSTAFLSLLTDDNDLKGEWHLALRDLQDTVGLDSNDDGLITWDELRAHSGAVCAYAISHLHIRGGSVPGTIHITDLLVDNHSDGAYAVLRFVVNGLGQPSSLIVNYQAFFDIDPKHRGLLRLNHQGSSRLAVFAPENPTQRFELLNDGPKRTPALTFVSEGVWHIWRGYDHILFLVALLLPGVLRRNHGAWEPVVAVRPAVMNVLKIVTAFTVAHSITLSLAALGVVHLPARLIESAIAGSVVLAALNNLTPFFAERGWMVAFGFGLLHGFGFANALHDLGLHAGQLAITLFGFNIGVEVGQLAIVALFLPIALSLRRLLFYSNVVLGLGSVSIIAISATWLAERALDFKWLPF